MKFTVVQLSEPVAFQLVPDFVYEQTIASVNTDWFATHEITGGSLSTTVIVKLQTDGFVTPEPSTTVHWTFVTPLLKVLPFKVDPLPVVTPDNIYE